MVAADVVARPPLTLLKARYRPPVLPWTARRRSEARAGVSVAADLACAFDPAKLSTRVGIAPDPWQRRLLRSEARQQLVLTSRQVGKSTTTAVLASHTAIYCPGEPVLILSPSLRQSSLLFAKIKWTLKRLGSEAVEMETDNALSVRLSNGSEIHSLPGKSGTVRGFSAVRLVIVDEAAFVADDLYTAVSPMLAVSGGRMILLSTPFGKRGFLYDQWEHGGEDWERIKVTADQCPRIPPEFLAAERRKLGVLYDQEYQCAFLDIQRAVFRHDDVARAITDDVQPLFALGEVA